MKITDLKQNEVIHCATKEEAVRICGMMHDAGLKWGSGESYKNCYYWEIHKRETCYCPIEGGFGRLSFCEEIRYTIHPSHLFQSEPEPSDEITEAGLRERGFKSLDNGWTSPIADWDVFIYFLDGKAMVELTDQPLTAVKTLTDIDHLIRLLGV